MKNAPGRIYLQVGDECPKDSDFYELSLEDVSWCDKKVFDNDLCYVRAGKPKNCSTGGIS